ncbi:MAG: ATP-dependent sacrificial sulfur transferase LarE [Desulfobulbaceae bacterium]|nr:ATP-dependent sacrificial sulfur transferase LarE [Desulfobulbaceae bacterium]
MNSLLADKYEALCAIIAKKGKVALAFSGGVDSTLLLKASMEATGGKVIALLAVTPLQPESETSDAINTANIIGASLQIRNLDPLTWPDFVKNPPDRCYLCKKAIYTDFKQYLFHQPDTILMDGTNLDDLQEDRPGRRAINELEVATPLVEAQLGKDEIRALSKALQLATWNKPSASCLATRIATGESINSDKLFIIARCERYLHDLGVKNCRVRLVRENHAFIELMSCDFNKLLGQEIRKQVQVFFKSMGFLKVFLDLSER